jgi:fibronectin type 3 domain-containing protein
VYRKTVGGDKPLWEKIYETKTDTTSFYIDDKITLGTKYLYTLVAIDKSGLESPPSPPLSIDIIKNLVKPAVKGLYTTVDRENKLIQLFWRYKEPSVQEFLIYKKKKGQTYSLFRTARVDEKQLIDIELSPNTTYYYGIKAIFNDGSVSKWVEIEVVY